MTNNELSPEQEAVRWADLDKILYRESPLAHPDFTPGDETKEFLQKDCKILIIGAGGLGCDLVKNLALSGFKNIHIIDMDTIDTSNLNRQFLFRDTDVGKSKSQTAAEFVNNRVPGVTVTPHMCAIQEKNDDFYRSFNIVICGLDSVEARRWINSQLISLCARSEDGEVDLSTMIPYIDGGTEGFKGQARVILPRMTSCYECTLDLLPPQVTYPMCTLAATPRLPEHCIEYVLEKTWSETSRKEDIADDEKVDGDNPVHIKWIFAKASERANQFGIRGVTYRLTQGVVKHIIPAIASTNAIIASACTNEALKLATLCSSSMDDYMLYNGNEGIYTYTYRNEKRPGCPVCGAPPPVQMTISPDMTLEQYRESLAEDPRFLFKNSSLRMAGKTIYIPAVKMIEEQTRPNLAKKMSEMVPEGAELIISDHRAYKGASIFVKISYKKE